MSNIITAHFAIEQTRAWTDELWQYDYGQILQFAGLELPNAYEVHFANQPHGVDSITQIGNADGVTIPDEFLLSGECVYAWVYLHTGVDDGETEYMVTIPVSKRAKPTHEEPTPVQQAEIEQAIAALNTAVNEAETAIEHYPKIEDGTWRVWDVTNEEWVDTGIEAQGDDGYSPSASVSKDGHTTTISVTDKSGTTTAQVLDGTDGDDGYSPQLTISDIQGGHRITITDATGTKYVDVMDGEQGDPGPGVPAGGQDGDILRKNGNDDFSSKWDAENWPVKNVLTPIPGEGGRPAGYVDIDTGVAWESGTIDSSGNPSDNGNLIRSSGFIAFDPTIDKIHIAYASDNIQASIFWYNENYEKTGASGNIDSIVPYDFDNPPAANRVYWKFTLRYKTSGQLPDDTLPSLLKIQYYDAGEPAVQTDRKTEIEDVLLNYGECILTQGDYYVSGISMPVGSKLRGVGEGTNLYLQASVTNGSAILPNGNNTISDIKIKRENGYTSKPSLSVGTDYGITCANNANQIRITNCDFEGFGGAGLYGYGSSSNDCMSAFIDNCRFMYCTTGIWFGGGMEFNSVSNSSCNSCYYGVQNQGGNNLFSNCHIDKNTVGWYQYGIGITPSNLGHGSAIGCTFNHNSSKAIFMHAGSNGFVFSGCQIWYGEVFIRALSGILFNSCEFGGTSVPLIFYGSTTKGHLFTDCTFSIQPTIDLRSSAVSSAYTMDNCFLFDGTPVGSPESVSGSTPSITAKSGIRYKCGEVATLDIVVPASGLFEVDFESGSTATVLTTTGATVTWPSWFDPTDLDSDTLYEISIQDGKGLVASWPA